MNINLKKGPKVVREWVREAEEATGLSGTALVIGAIMAFRQESKKNCVSQPRKDKTSKPKKPIA